MTIEPADRERQVRRVLAIEMGINLAVASAKLVVGGLLGSLAILTDAVHSGTDAVANLFGFAILKAAGRPPDAAHPYGHRKIEVLAACGIGLVIGASAVSFGYQAVTALLDGNRGLPKFSVWGVLFVILNLAIGTLVAAYEARMAKRLQSHFLHADSVHTASDVMVTVAVLVGYGLSAVDIAWGDPLAALIVLGVILYNAWKILAMNVAVLIDTAVIDADAVRAIALSHPGVVDCHRIRSRGLPSSASVDLHLVVDGAMKLEKAHEIGHQVGDSIRAKFPGIVDVHIHTEPNEFPLGRDEN